VSLELAVDRAARISNLRYELSFEIPEGIADPVSGRAVVRFDLAEPAPMTLDFAAPSDHLHDVSVNGQASQARLIDEHIVIAGEETRAGTNEVEVSFRAGDAALNRNAEFLYALFVPARARLAFPCFDQPDLKARYSLTLVVPGSWEAIANGPEIAAEATDTDGRRRLRFAETEPVPTYLFAFAAGRFQIETAERGGRILRMFHRETDRARLERNRDAIFDLHASALAWLEDYTAYPYPWGKFDFVLIPSFQFGGMEHPGAIYYDANALMLEESVTEGQLLRRASLIAHETSHMWFGDLVTMKWFDDVWMKEVFANFLAEKIVNPEFPGVNHELRFLTAHYPAAYSVDRTAGTHPIRQELLNLNEAGSLYGPIIYQKAPIVMRQLERLVGADALRDGLRIYLRTHAFANATWRDLIAILDPLTGHDLAAWSHAWVDQAGRPLIRTEVTTGEDGGRVLRFVQRDPVADRGLMWTQQVQALVGSDRGTTTVPLTLQGDASVVPSAGLPRRISFVLPTGGGLAYGEFELDAESRRWLLEYVDRLDDPVARGAAWVTLWDEMLANRIAPADFARAIVRALPRESVEQNVQLIVRYLNTLFWRFLRTEDRAIVGADFERVLQNGWTRTTSSSLKATFFNAFRSMVTTESGVALLERVWRRDQAITGLTFGEIEEAAMAHVARVAAAVAMQRREQIAGALHVGDDQRFVARLGVQRLLL